MSIRNSWYVPDRIILTHIYDRLTVPDSRTSAEEITAMLRSTDKIVHNIVDLRHVTRYPTNVHQLTPLTSCMQEPNHGWLLLVMNKNPVMKFLASLVLKTVAENFQVFTSPDELIWQLPHIDSSLPTPLPPYVFEQDLPAASSNR